jgi:hypothetical protein
VTGTRPDPVDEAVTRVLDEHLLAGPRPGQCRCGYGDETLPVRHLGRSHSAHVAEELRAAGVLRDALTLSEGGTRG